MKVHLSNGNRIRVSREEANLIIEAMNEAVSDDKMFFLTRRKVRYAMFKFAQIDAIK
jgi:hypothetical protein